MEGSEDRIDAGAPPHASAGDERGGSNRIAPSEAEALTLIQHAIDQYGPRPELLDTRAIVQLNLGSVAPALHDLERVVNEAPTPTRLFHLSRAHEKARNLPSALASLRQANAQGLTPDQLHPAERVEYRRVSAELTKRP